ncbi:hypothetical protein A8709_32460 [Paenibacillus pectinilyticus]|uniref:Uncharacterized protein n=1 Tax=Paenibacillus pectinilyticus TaxID=512399 RepID=A0A1C0ZWR0_9BACL|nr:hypothetical protein [Paenibacillus pectinilyticus]OCT12536.1 hypothetical protein A8709_32460 [Paenibacillus pectinilyticus]
MDKLRTLFNELEAMKQDLQNRYTSWSNKFDIIGDFVESGLDDAISVIDQALDRIQELEDELEEAQEIIDEMEREQ